MANIFIEAVYHKNVFVPGIDSLILVMNISIQYFYLKGLDYIGYPLFIILLICFSFIFIYATDICIRWLTWKFQQKKDSIFLSLPNAHKSFLNNYNLPQESNFIISFYGFVSYFFVFFKKTIVPWRQIVS